VDRGYGGDDVQVSGLASSEEERKRLDLLVDEASMLSFPASDPPAVFLEEPEATPERASGTAVAPRGTGDRPDETDEAQA
jgi:hypothetical protein